jgi:hypothetical protein
MENLSLDSFNMSTMSAEGLLSFRLVDKYIQAMLRDDLKVQLKLLSDEITLDYSGKFGYGKIKLRKADAINFHKELRSRIELVDYNIFKAFGDDNTVIILGNKTEKIRESGILIAENCIWVFTIEDELIAKVEYLKESHALFAFFSTIIDSDYESKT